MSDSKPQETADQPTTGPQVAAHPVGALYEIRWSEVCPWLILVKALRVTLMLRVLLLAMVGVLLTHGGDATIDRIFPEKTSKLRRTTELYLPGQFLQLALGMDQPNGDTLMRPQGGPLLQGWRWMAKPFWLLANPEFSWKSSQIMLLHGLWTIGVWGIFGGAIARIAAHYLTRGETIGPWSALCEATAVWPSTAGSPLIALLAAMALAVPLLLLGALLRLHSLAIVVGLLWVIVLAWGFVLAVVLVGLLVGWPLMWACLGVERSDAFDGVSRSYAYVYQRPLHLACYVLFAVLLVFLGEAVVDVFATATLTLSERTLSLGAGNERLVDLLRSDSLPIAKQAIHGWKWVFTSFVSAYPLACLWPMAVGIYLLLRRQVDATEMDEITLPAALPKSFPAHDPTPPE